MNNKLKRCEEYHWNFSSFNLSSLSRAGHHPGRRTHSALRPTSEVLWHDWQIPFNTGLGMKRPGADQSASTLESSLLIVDSWFERQCKSARCWIWTHLCSWFTSFFLAFLSSTVCWTLDRSLMHYKWNNFSDLWNNVHILDYFFQRLK